MLPIAYHISFVDKKPLKWDVSVALVVVVVVVVAAAAAVVMPLILNISSGEA